MTSYGALLGGWRRRRRLSQLDLALHAGISARHLSFLETGRAHPSRGMVLRLAERLDVPLRDRNALLLAAGLAPAFGEHGIDDPALGLVRVALDTLLAAHAPWPALVVDRHWTLVAANAGVAALLDGVAAPLLVPPVNVLRLALHPDGLASRIANLAEFRADLLARLRRSADQTGDPELATLHVELGRYPGDAAPEPSTATPILPLRLRVGDAILSFMTTTTVFGAPHEAIVSELALETFLPADDATRAWFGAR